MVNDENRKSALKTRKPVSTKKCLKNEKKLEGERTELQTVDLYVLHRLVSN
jgi:hypothetical protein